MTEIKIIEYLQKNIKNKYFISFLNFLSDSLYFPMGFLIYFIVILSLQLNFSTSLFALIVTLINESINFSLKYIFKRKRPYLKNPNLLKDKYKPKSYSFPSGHSSVSMIIALFVYNYINNKLIFLYPILVGLSRVYLGVHYPTDVLFGYITGYLTINFIYYYKIFTFLI